MTIEKNKMTIAKLEKIEDAILDMISLRCSIQRNLEELNLDGDIALHSGCETLSDTLSDVRLQIVQYK